MKLYAISDLHVGFDENREILRTMGNHPEDWLILGGDLGETEEHLRIVFDALGPKFRRLVWVPGNHELYSEPNPAGGILRGQEKYLRLVEACRAANVLTPEEPYPVWEGEGGAHLLAPLFLLYDYSFRPAQVRESDAVAWAMESGLFCSDEMYLDPFPYASRADWCRARVEEAAGRLEKAPDLPTVLINHFPLREQLVRLPMIPRFSIWCGTKLTADWHRRFRAKVVVSGHLHLPRTEWQEGVRFEEVSLGYPRQRPLGSRIQNYLRQILPEPEKSAARW